MSGTRLIVSVHVAKTGGNTFATILERAARGLWCQRYGADHPQTGLWLEGVRLTPVDDDQLFTLTDRLLEVPSIVARTSVIHGHINANTYFERYPWADMAVWLRDPVERVMSHYEFWKRTEGLSDPLYERFVAEDMSPEDFAAEPRIRNTQTRTTGRRPIEDFAFVGITERYDESLELFGRMYDVDTDDVVQLNYNPERSRSGYDIDEDTRRAIEAHNVHDLALYRRGLERFEELNREAPPRQDLPPHRRLVRRLRSARR